MPADYEIYEHLLNSALATLVAAGPKQQLQLEMLDAADSHERLAQYLGAEIARVLRGITGEDAPQTQAEVINRMMATLRELVPPGPPDMANLVQPPQLLLAKYAEERPRRTRLPFSISTVLTNARGEPALGHELAREIETADAIDALISFITFSGVRALRAELEGHARAGRAFRLLTTTYTGATDPAAVEVLARLPNVEVRISYDTRRTRLHAKAWLFSRLSGLDTAYVGSANLSSAALFHGNEWMMKATARDLPAVIEKVRGTFETLWNDAEFESFDPANPEHGERLRAAIAKERGGDRKGGTTPVFFTLRPYPYQAELLDRLEAERSLYSRFRNLVVAATGTGKTVIAAFDYQRQIGKNSMPPRMLFLAHREEILEQALMTFRNVLRDGSFGTLMAGGNTPSSYDHLFATIQSFNSRGLLERQGPDYWDYVVVDECHHIPAASYRDLMTRIQPRLLVGLTATPERADGKSLREDFEGHVAAEIRLWHALERQLLVPFEYYGVSDNTDLRNVRWSRGAYAVDELDNIYSSNDRRAELVIEQTMRRVGNPQEMRALGFCVSVKHAKFMAKKFTEAGIPALALHGDSTDQDRQEAPRRLASGDIKVLFTCDLYNEGVDLPFVDTLLLLRPTSSAPLFLQQLGRGLRLFEKKSSCLVLDFIGQHRDDFRFDPVLTAMTGLPRGRLGEAVEQGFPALPSGCHLALDRVAREHILASLRRQIRGGERRLLQELSRLKAESDGPISLAAFLEGTGLDLTDVFTDRISWLSLRRAAGLEAPVSGSEENVLQPKLKQLLHLDDPDLLGFYQAWLGGPDLLVPSDPLSQRRVLMLAYQLFHLTQDCYSPAEFTALLRRNPGTVDDLLQLFGVLEERIAIARVHPRPHPDWPLSLHRRYGRREVLAATGLWTETKKPSSREGVARVPEGNAELLFVTLDKSGKHFSPTTSYEDYAIGPELFHWQTQSGVSPESPTGQRYIEQRQNGWQYHLFVRTTPKDAFTYLGPVSYVKHTGSRPMSITWKLATSIPGRWLEEFLRLSA